MCEFAIYKENKAPMCEVTNKLCTLCVLGNADTYKKGVAAREGELERKRGENRENSC